MPTAEPVAVTGARGHLGPAVVADLVAHGHPVVALDREPGRTAEGEDVRTVLWDGADVATLAEALTGCTALVHLAAIPGPWSQPDEVVFGNNTTATFAALQAATGAGIRRVVVASSVSAYGTAWSPEPTHVRYVPVDETHPLLVSDPYGLSKEVDERTAAMYCRRYPDLSVAALRFHWIASLEQARARVAEVARTMASPDVDWPELLRELWGYVELRDAARACRLALEAAAVRTYGFRPLNVVAADALVEGPVTELLRGRAPDIEIRADLGPTAGAFSTARAAEVIGWVPEHSWRDVEVPATGR